MLRFIKSFEEKAVKTTASRKIGVFSPSRRCRARNKFRTSSSYWEKTFCCGKKRIAHLCTSWGAIVILQFGQTPLGTMLLFSLLNCWLKITFCCSRVNSACGCINPPLPNINCFYNSPANQDCFLPPFLEKFSLPRKLIKRTNFPPNNQS